MENPPIFMGKSTISTGPFSIPEGIAWLGDFELSYGRETYQE
jgi:hypothetical protein